ncbi:hypothetical protein BX264_0129 [Streptomyces sp. 2333.5]|nr:hypothetical protein BX264_0129 [Streptomyces sp. 2333.5]SEB62166.1 hypothetical protein SAMN05428943_0128 [Streptomyces sp. 2314.4]SEC45717.1 hypothetical protein SAMN05428942_0128 [Streptomyces sp. 2112.2]
MCTGRAAYGLTVLMAAVPNRGWRRYNGCDVESEPWAAR